MPLGGLLTAGLVAGGAIGGMASQGSANRSIRDRLSEQMGDQVTFDPELLKRKIYKQYQVTGVMTPEMEQALSMADEQLAIAKADPEGIQAQKQALAQLAQRSQVGMTPEERANLASIQVGAAKDAEAKRQQILQNAQQRGQGGAGSDLAASLMASQAASEQANQASLMNAANASSARMDALAKFGALGGDIRGASYRESAGEADSRNALARFNLENQRSVQQRNIGNKNTSQEMNLRRGWDVADRNVGLSNKAMDDQETARYRRMGIDADNLTRRNDARGAMSAQDAREGAQRSQMWNTLGQAAGGAATKFGSSSGTSAPSNTSSYTGAGSTNYQGKQWWEE
jgi:hypothetical protein